MNNQLTRRLELFVTNTQAIKKDFIWQNTILMRSSALLYAIEDKTIDCDAIRQCYNLIKDNTGLLSMFRGNSALSIAAMLSLSDDPNKLLSNTLAVYDLMKEMRFRASDYLAVAAYQIAAYGDSNEYRRTAERAKAFYDGMKEKHWFYTGQDDYIFSAMLGLSDLEIEPCLAYMENLYASLKPEFFSGNSVQTLTQVLALGAKADEAIVRILALRDEFRNKNLKLDKTYTLSSLGVLSLLPVGVDAIAADVLEAHDYLCTQKGFGVFSITKQELLLLTSGIVSSLYVDGMKNGILTTTISTSITNIIIAQQAAMVAATSSSVAAASSASQ